jgi:type I restriction enzyme S subunit
MKIQNITLSDTISEGGVFIDGDWIESKDQDQNGEVRLVQLADIGDGVFLNKSRRYLTKESALKLRCTFIQKGDILIARMPDPIGRACIFPGDIKECVTAVDVCIVRPNSPEVSNEYLKNIINSSDFRNKIIAYTTGTTRKRISRSNLDKICFCLPPLKEQTRIADLLTRAERLIAKRKDSIKALDELLKSTFLEMFGDPVRNEKGWEKTRIDEIADVRIGPFGSLLHAEDYVENGIPLINPSHIVEGEITPNNKLTITPEKYRELKAYQLEIDDVVVARRGEIGRCAIVHTTSPLFCGTGSMFIRITGDYSPVLLQYQIAHTSLKEYLESKAKGVTMKNLNSTTLGELRVLHPPLGAQENFTSVVEKIEALKIMCAQNINEHENFRSVLTQQVFMEQNSFCGV